MKRFLMIFLFVVACALTSSGQTAAGRWYIGGGLSFPLAPDQFYDYWKQGYQVTAGMEFPGSSEFTQMILLDANYFPFDQTRFFKRAGITNSSTTVKGATTLLFTLAYCFRYTFLDYSSFQPSFFAGVGCSGSMVSSSTIEYPNAQATAGSRNSFMVAVPLGGSVRVYEENGAGVDLNFTYTLSLLRKETSNGNYSSLKVIYSFTP